MEFLFSDIYVTNDMSLNTANIAIFPISNTSITFH